MMEEPENRINDVGLEQCRNRFEAAETAEDYLNTLKMAGGTVCIKAIPDDGSGAWYYHRKSNGHLAIHLGGESDEAMEVLPSSVDDDRRYGVELNAVRRENTPFAKEGTDD